MTVVRFLVLILTGRLVIWFLQTAGPLQKIRQFNAFTGDLFSCDFCLGVWVFWLLGIGQSPIFGIWPKWLEIGLFGVIGSFVSHIGRLGWAAKFGITVYE